MKTSSEPHSQKGHAFWLNPVAVLLGALALFFVSQIAGAFLAEPITYFITNKNIQLALYMGLGLLVLVACLVLAKRAVGFTWAAIGLRRPRLKWIAAVVPSFLLYLLLSTALTAVAVHFIPSFKAGQSQDIGFSQATKIVELGAMFISLVIITPIFEEFIFRGILFRGLRKRLSFWVSAVLTSLLFAFAHLQWNVAIDVFALSLIMCFLVEKSDSILPTIALHALKNSVAFILLFLIK